MRSLAWPECWHLTCACLTRPPSHASASSEWAQNTLLPSAMASVQVALPPGVPSPTVSHPAIAAQAWNDTATRPGQHANAKMPGAPRNEIVRELLPSDGATPCPPVASCKREAAWAPSATTTGRASNTGEDPTPEPPPSMIHHQGRQSRPQRH